MDEQEKQAILTRARTWFRETIVLNHHANTIKLVDPKKLKINPFTAAYLANYLTGNSSAESMARVLIYPRVLGTSIATSFGTQMQRFTTDVLSSLGSMIGGIDIEFVDALDGRKKYCQLKAGPATINKDDVQTMHRHFQTAYGIARTNRVLIAPEDFVVGVLYGSQAELSANYKNITKQHNYPVWAGQLFWHHLTGDARFYRQLIDVFGEVAEEIDGTTAIEETVQKLAKNLIRMGIVPE
jgi:hypothetical protein